MFKNLIFPLLLIPLVNLLTLDSNSKFRELPEYSEYLRKLGLSENNTTRPTIPTTSSPSTPPPSSSTLATKAQSPLNQIDTYAPLPQFPLVEICKQSPTDFYGHVICWTLLLLYILLIASLVIYQLRSYFWLRNNHRNGQHSNRENSKF